MWNNATSTIPQKQLLIVLFNDGEKPKVGQAYFLDGVWYWDWDATRIKVPYAIFAWTEFPKWIQLI